MSTPASGLDAPFPWFGGKSRVAALVWERFGRVHNYVEPFFGSGAVLLGRPNVAGGGLETVNDLDGFVANFWRAVRAAPDECAEWADSPVNETDLHARHAWLVAQRPTLTARLEGDPEFYDARIAGWWAWGISCWIGGGFCSGRGPWAVVEREGSRQLVHLGDGGQGVKRQLVHLGNNGQGVKRQRVHLGDNGQSRLGPWFRALAARLSRVRVASGDWSRVCGPSPTFKHGLTAVFLDPPYADAAERDQDLYAKDSPSVAHDVRAWAIEAGKRSDMRIALCGYEGEHEMPASWRVVSWKTMGGYAARATNLRDADRNQLRERIWFSPACLDGRQASLFAPAEAAS